MYPMKSNLRQLIREVLWYHYLKNEIFSSAYSEFIIGHPLTEEEVWKIADEWNQVVSG